MGSNVSIVNETNCILNICLKQLFPLYFENLVVPGQRMERVVGKVWFTIEARIWNCENDYNYVDNMIPNTNKSTDLIDSSFLETLPIYKDITLPNNLYKSGSGLIVASDTDQTQSINNLVSGVEIRSHGWYFDTDRTFAIRGGPKAFSKYNDDGNIVQFLEMNANCPKFTIVSIDR